MKIKVRFYRAIAKIILAFVIVIFVGVVVFVALQISGKNSLYGQYKGVAPNLPQENLPESAEDAELEDWQEGDVRYKGVHYRYNEEILTFLFLGIDEMGEVKTSQNGIDGGQSDAIFLVVLNPHSKEVTVIGIPRDTMADVAVYNKKGEYVGNATVQLTLQHGYGDGAHVSCERTVEAVSKLFYDLPIHGYCAINMGAIPLINDAVGGVEITVLEDIISTNMKEGQTVLLKGKDAYSYLHNRDTKSEGSAMRRQERQRQYMAAYAKTATAVMKEDITLPVTLYNTISKYMVTDISVDEVSYLATQVLDYRFSNENIHTLEGENLMGDRFEEFYVDEMALYELILQVFYEEVT